MRTADVVVSAVEIIVDLKCPCWDRAKEGQRESPDGSSSRSHRKAHQAYISLPLLNHGASIDISSPVG